MGFVISVLHEKGGVGKTTLSVCLAGELASRGYELLLVDADPTESSQAWAQPGHLDFSVVGYPVVPGQTEAWTSSVSKLKSPLLVIDCAPNDFSLAAACALSDVVLLPCGPSGLDFDGTQRALAHINAVKATRSKPLRVMIVPTRVDIRTLEGRQIIEELRHLGEWVAPPLGYRVDYVRAFAAGQSLNTYAPGGEADLEIKALAAQVLRGMSLQSAA